MNQIEKYLTNNNNPPKFIVEFFDEQKNINMINCFSDEEISGGNLISVLVKTP